MVWYDLLTYLCVLLDIIERLASLEAVQCTEHSQIGQVWLRSAMEWSIFQLSQPFIACRVHVTSYVIGEIVAFLESFAKQEHDGSTRVDHQMSLPARKKNVPLAGFREPFKCRQGFANSSIHVGRYQVDQVAVGPLAPLLLLPAMQINCMQFLFSQYFHYVNRRNTTYCLI